MDSKYVSTKSTSLVLVFVGMVFFAVIGFSSYFLINALVNPPVVGFEINYEDVNRTYEVGQSFSHHGLRVYAVFQNGNRMQLSPFDANDPDAPHRFYIDLNYFNATNQTPGPTQVLISYRNFIPQAISVTIVPSLTS